MSWPKIEIRLQNDGTALISEGGIITTILPASPTIHTDATSIAAKIAGRYGRPLDVTATGADGTTWELLAQPDGTIESTSEEPAPNPEPLGQPDQPLLADTLLSETPNKDTNEVDHPKKLTEPATPMSEPFLPDHENHETLSTASEPLDQPTPTPLAEPLLAEMTPGEHFQTMLSNLLPNPNETIPSVDPVATDIDSVDRPSRQKLQDLIETGPIGPLNQPTPTRLAEPAPAAIHRPNRRFGHKAMIAGSTVAALLIVAGTVALLGNNFPEPKTTVAPTGEVAEIVWPTGEPQSDPHDQPTPTPLAETPSPSPSPSSTPEVTVPPVETVPVEIIETTSPETVTTIETTPARPVTEAPAPPPVSITSLDTTVATAGAGSVSVTVTVGGSGTTSISATVGGKSSTISVTAPGSATTIINGIEPGSKSWSTSGPGLSNSGTLTIY